MDENLISDAPVQSQSWCVEWFGSQGRFHCGQSQRADFPKPLRRFESLYAVGPLENAAAARYRFTTASR